MNIEEPFRQDPSEELAKRIAYLINGYIRKKLTVSEHQELDDWVSDNMKNQQLFEELTDPANIKKWINWKEDVDSRTALKRIKSKLGFKQESRSFNQRRIWPYGAVAAAIVIGIILYSILLQRRVSISQPPVTALKQDILPGGKHAVLKLNDGISILLDTVKSGEIQDGQELTIKKDSDELKYTTAVRSNPRAAFNELSTPAGGEYQVRLSDGTRVWLNASSTIKYPEQFSDSSRIVELIGEAYFEVAKDASHPFILLTGKNDIRVLGTHFNVNNYSDNLEAVVTLEEGSVKLNGSAMLKPGEQGVIDQSGKIQTGPADLESALAWKNGQFIFNGTPLEKVMQQVSHWYDARIYYKDNVTDHFNARIPRNVPVSKLLHLLEATGRVHFKIEEKTITVMN
jgi:transmembrane sensor